MKAIYDKVLLLLAALIAAAGGAYYFMNPAETEVAPRSPVQASGETFESIDFTVDAQRVPQWSDPAEQSTGWVFDVFTPPKIYIDPETNEFIRIPPRSPADAEPFGIYLASVERELYRFQFQGYAEVDASDPSTSIIYVFDTVNNQQINARSGREYPDAGFAIRSFTIERIEEDGIITREAVVTLYDKAMEREIQMRQNEVIYTGETRFHFASREFSDFSHVATQVGDTFEAPGGSYRITNINIANESVTVEKAATETYDAQIQVLTPRPAAATAPAGSGSQRNGGTNSTNGTNNIFDELF
jgi:hypothetical protein